MATWQTFADAAPDLAGKGRALLYIHGPGLGYLATVRKDGGPRMHPVCPILAEGRLWVLVLPQSPKFRDLERDGRFALHTFSAEELDDEFYVTGRAIRNDGKALREKVTATSAATGVKHGGHDQLFELDLEHAMYAAYRFRGDWPPTYEKWHAIAPG